jgi:hypothetical protein
MVHILHFHILFAWFSLSGRDSAENDGRWNVHLCLFSGVCDYLGDGGVPGDSCHDGVVGNENAPEEHEGIR